MITLQSLRSVIKDELNEFEDYFASLMKTDNRLLNLVLKYVLKTKGKQLRPILVFYSSKLNGQTNKNSFVAAALIELLHTATLIHDDVVDNSQLRRGFFSIKALWKSKIAVLIGDYLLAKGLLISVDSKAFDLLEIVSEAVKEMAEGELLQIEKARKLDISQDLYFEIIRKKTAVLLAAATSSGTKAVTDDTYKLNIMKKIGLNLGLAFQIKDDLFDFLANEKTIGKPVGNDIREKKITLPLIYALNNSDKKNKRKILSLIAKNNLKNSDIKFIVDFVKQTGGIDFAVEKMIDYKNKAVDLLMENYPDTLIRQKFIDLLNFIVQRKK